jgi:hypothetical protein
MALSSDREKLAKLKDNGNENNVDTGDNLDDYNKCILELVIQEEKLTSAKKEDEKRKKANQQDQSARLQAVSKVYSRVHVADKNTGKRVCGGNVRDKTLDKELAEVENEMELVEEELRDPDQMNVDQRGEDLVQDVRDRTTTDRRKVARLCAQIQHSVSSDDDSGDEGPDGRMCSTLKTQEDGADTQLQRELRENAEINTTEMEGSRKRVQESASKTKKRESPNAGLQLNRQRSTATVLADGHVAQEQMLEFLKEQSCGESQFRTKFLQDFEADRLLRTQQILLAQMFPETKKVWVREESHSHLGGPSTHT